PRLVSSKYPECEEQRCPWRVQQAPPRVETSLRESELVQVLGCDLSPGLGHPVSRDSLVWSLTAKLQMRICPVLGGGRPVPPPRVPLGGGEGNSGQQVRPEPQAFPRHREQVTEHTGEHLELAGRV